MKRNFYSVRHIQRVQAMERKERRLRLRMAAQRAAALCVMSFIAAINVWAVATWPGVQ